MFHYPLAQEEVVEANRKDDSVGRHNQGTSLGSYVALHGIMGNVTSGLEMTSIGGGMGLWIIVWGGIVDNSVGCVKNHQG